MALQFILGGAGTGKTQYCWEQIKECVRENPLGSPCIMLVPEQASFTYEKMLVSQLTEGGSMRAQVLSFQRLAHLVRSKKSLVQPVYMNEIGRSMVLSELVRNHQQELTVLQNAARGAGFIPEISRLFKELQQYCISVEQLNHGQAEKDLSMDKQASDKISMEFEQMFAAKLQDIGLLYRAWQEVPLDGYQDSEEILTELLPEIKQCDWLKEARIWVDGFTSFSKQEQLVLLEMAKHCSHLSVTLCLPIELLKYLPISQQNAFYHIYRTREQLLFAGQTQGIAIEKDVLLSHCYRYQEKKALHCLVEGILTYPVRLYNGQDTKEQIHLCAGADLESEMIFVARKLQQLAAENHWHYRDFAIITRDMQRYQNVVQRVFQQMEIPVYVDEKQSFYQHPLVELIRAALEVVAENWRADTVLRYLKCGLVGESRQEIDILETYVLAAGINYQRWYQKKDWTYVPQNWHQEEIYALSEINRIRKALLSPLEIFAASLQEGQSGQGFARAILALLEALQVEEKISAWYEKATETGNLVEAEIHKRAVEEVRLFLQQLESFMARETYTVAELLPLLEQSFKEMQIAMTPPALDAVFFSDVENSRMPEVKCCFVVGLNEGFFPAKHGEEGIFSSAERDVLEQRGILLGPNRDRRQYMEEYFLYVAMSRSTEQLYLSYALSDEKGSSLQPSLVVGKIREMFPLLKETYFSGKAEDLTDWQLLVGKNFDFANLGNVLREVQRGRSVPDFWQDVYNFYLQQPQFKQKMENMRETLLNRSYDTPYLSQAVAGKFYGKHIYSSVSRLEQFKQCPFAHFAGFGLKLKKRLKYQPGKAETGGIFHQTLAYTGKSLAEKNLTWSDLTETEALQAAQEAVQKIAGEYWGDIADNEEKYQYLQQKLAQVIATVMVALGEQLKQGEFTPVAWELSFGEDKDLPALTLALPDGGKLIISGAIDRVDCAQKEERTWLRVIDYKSSDKNLSLNDIFYGLKMQLLLYMQVVLSNSAMITQGKEANSAGVYYFTLKDAMVSALQKLEDKDAKDAWLKEFKMSGIAVKDVEAVFLADKEIDGYSNVIPVAMNRQGEFRKNSSGLTIKQMNALQKHILLLLQQAGYELMQGFIAVKPWRQGNFDACAYCDFKAICGFSRDLQCPNYEKSLTDAEIWQALEKEEVAYGGKETVDGGTAGSH